MFGRFRKKNTASAAGAGSAEDVVAACRIERDIFFQVVGPEDGACVCNDWVGAVLCFDSDSSTYPSLPAAIADGLFHSGCRHSLRAYDAAAHSTKELSEAAFRTQLAVDAMRRRAAAGEPDAEERFTRLYGWARRVDKAGSPAAAAILCESALAILRGGNVFGPSQADLERILKARIATIRARL